MLPLWLSIFFPSCFWSFCPMIKNWPTQKVSITSQSKITPFYILCTYQYFWLYLNIIYFHGWEIHVLIPTTHANISFIAKLMKYDGITLSLGESPGLFSRSRLVFQTLRSDVFSLWTRQKMREALVRVNLPSTSGFEDGWRRYQKKNAGGYWKREWPSAIASEERGFSLPQPQGSEFLKAFKGLRKLLFP